MRGGRLAKLRGLSCAERRLVLGALARVAFVRAALWLLPYRVVRGWVARASAQKIAGGRGAERIAWAVSSVSRAVPGATCLTQALAASVLLSREGIAHTVRIGVLRGAGGAFRAHAWVEAEGRVILGETGDLAEFRELR